MGSDSYFENKQTLKMPSSKNEDIDEQVQIFNQPSPFQSNTNSGELQNTLLQLETAQAVDSVVSEDRIQKHSGYREGQQLLLISDHENQDGSNFGDANDKHKHQQHQLQKQPLATERNAARPSQIIINENSHKDFPHLDQHLSKDIVSENIAQEQTNKDDQKQ